MTKRIAAMPKRDGPTNNARPTGITSKPTKHE